jgi:hypothetical protein
MPQRAGRIVQMLDHMAKRNGVKRRSGGKPAIQKTLVNLETSGFGHGHRPRIRFDPDHGPPQLSHLVQKRAIAASHVQETRAGLGGRGQMPNPAIDLDLSPGA